MTFWAYILLFYKMGGKAMIDLHIHTEHSDGKQTVGCINELATMRNISVLSITDHDSLDAIGEIETLQDGSRIWIPGIEISTENNFFGFKLKAHLLGYGFDYCDALLRKRLQSLYEVRASDNFDYICELIKMFPFLSFKSFEGAKLGKYGWISKKILGCLEGQISTEEIDALSKYMEYNRPKYRGYNVPIEEAIDLIKNAGGYPVIAHPFKLQVSEEKQRELIVWLKGLGLSGIEAYNAKGTRQEKAYFHGLAQELELYETGGTDFHVLTDSSFPGCDPMEINEESMFIKKLIKEKKTIGDYYAKKE